MKPLVIYHGNCPDGFAAAYAFWLKHHDSFEYLPLPHSSKPYKGLNLDLVKDREVYMVDIAFENRDEALHVQALTGNQLTIIDHHITAFNHLDGLDFFHFDINHSGAVLAYQYCFPGEDVPFIFRYIEDRDLHNWKLKHAEEILLAIDCWPKDFKEWLAHLYIANEYNNNFDYLYKEGIAIKRYNDALVANAIKSTHSLIIRGQRVPAVNSSILQTYIGNKLADVPGIPFAAVYYQNGDEWAFSLRSNKTFGMDVEKIAKSFPTGGGHKHASGFRVQSLSHLNIDSNENKP